ncbi:hypothetical protein FOZ61_005318, partial [Perkinsus olseni]
MIEENYEALEGKFSGTVTKQSRQEAWKNIVSAGLTKGWSVMFAKFSPVDLEKGRAGDVKIVNGMIRHLRDGKWGELKRRYTSRRDRNAKTGAGGGKQAVELDDIDRHVERILTSGGKAATQGLDVESDCGDGPRQVVE